MPLSELSRDLLCRILRLPAEQERLVDANDDTPKILLAFYLNTSYFWELLTIAGY
jgi:hypothetical protein